MQNILMLEIESKNKVPPIGLMKIATYHNQYRNDFVWFSKGKLQTTVSDKIKTKIQCSKYHKDRYVDLEQYINNAEQTIENKKWDKVYISSLFTFDWDKTVELIEYAKTLVDDVSKIFVGGISATLMPKDFEMATGVKPHIGLLSDSSELGYEKGICIDSLIPDYSILECIEFKYHFADSYILTATRGCGNKCSFCAVQRLEPEYQDYIPLIPRIEKIKNLYGEKKNLYLMDNNVLKSKQFEQIISDIKKAGFGREDTWINPITKKPNLRYVDFNQGLDSKFLTEEKVKLLGEIALKPAHIAFDNISEKDRYLKAVALMNKYDIKNISSFLLYNTRKISSKGTLCQADTPKELYERMQINRDINIEINKKRKLQGKKKFDAFAFPMRFVPLNYKDRSFVGDNWTNKLLNGVTGILQPSRGGVYVTPDFFNHMYGNNYDEFYRLLLMPIQYVKNKGLPLNKYPLGKHPKANWLRCIKEWKCLYSSLSSQSKADFEKLISDNAFTPNKFEDIKNVYHKKLYLHYFTGKKIVAFLQNLSDTSFDFALDFIKYECPAIYWCSLNDLGKNNKEYSILTDLMADYDKDGLSA